MNELPLASFANTRESAWQFYIGGSVAIRETNAGEIQVKLGDATEWTTVGTKEVYA